MVGSFITFTFHPPPLTHTIQSIRKVKSSERDKNQHTRRWRYQLIIYKDEDVLLRVCVMKKK